MSRILPLPPEALSQVHSSRNITSLHDAVLALFQNSLDARSASIEVTVDFRRGACTVEDNGDGIAAAEFRENGGLGKLHHTSKSGTVTGDNIQQLHGSAGTHLASLASLSLLTIAARQAGHVDFATLTMHHGRFLSRQVYPGSPGEGFSQRSDHGTRVVVRDLFGNMPVRVKQRIMTAKDGNDGDKAWLTLKHAVTALVLGWPLPCSVQMRDSNHEKRNIHLASSHPSMSAALTKHGLRLLDKGKTASFGLTDKLPILLQASIAPSQSRSSWVPVSASAVDSTVRGLICLQPAPTKRCQFLSVGIQPLSASSSHGDVYDAINKIFTSSSFGAIAESSDDDEQDQHRRRRDRRYKGDGYTQKQLHGRKGIDRWPMFVLQVELRDRRTMHSIAERMSEVSLKGIIEVLEATITQWLSAHHFRPRKTKPRRKNENHKAHSSTAGVSRAPLVDAARQPSSASKSAAMSSELTATMQSRTTSKRGRVLDLSEDAHDTQQSSTKRSGGALEPFSTFSRIKRGRTAVVNVEPEVQRPATAPQSSNGTVAGRLSGQKWSAILLPALQAGALNTPRQQQSVERDDPTLPATPQSQDVGTVWSSEDFGSIDEDAMVVLVEGVHLELDHGKSQHRHSALPESHTDELLEWINPHSKQKFLVNARNGAVLSPRPKYDASHRPRTAVRVLERQSAAIDTSVSSASRPVSLAWRGLPRRPSHNFESAPTSQWLQGFLKAWDNPVFVRQHEQSILVALLDGPETEAEAASSHASSHHQGLSRGVFENVGKSTMNKLTKACLQTAKVIRQVDRKYILCTAAGSGGEKLVLVDQHAASERVILEKLFAELCEPADIMSRSAVKTATLGKPLRFQVSIKEHELFLEHVQHFTNWGILYSVSQRVEPVSPSQGVMTERRKDDILTVTALPPGIAERCTLVPRLLIELLRSEVWALTDSAQRTASRLTLPASEGNDGQHWWLKRIGSCPKGIVEMLNSRACRSAVMFNDELDVGQCEGLMSSLAQCAFPFMCAHGRVSMVPLIELGGARDEDGSGTVVLSGYGRFKKAGKDDHGEGSSVAVFRQWMKSGADSVSNARNPV